MFGFLKRKTREIKSPVDGQVIALESVEDEVFSSMSLSLASSSEMQVIARLLPLVLTKSLIFCFHCLSLPFFFAMRLYTMPLLLTVVALTVDTAKFL